MEYINKYFSDIYFIISAYNRPPADLNHIPSIVRKDISKTMLIGVFLALSVTFSMHKKYYLWKDYAKSSLLGAVFGLGYSPYFLVHKINREYLTLAIM